jgi:hypothetical protein
MDLCRFLWDESDTGDSWEVQLARRYYDKLFKEYCIVDLSRWVLVTVLGIRSLIRIRRTRMFLNLLDPDPLVRDTDPDPASDPSLFS